MSLPEYYSSLVLRHPGIVLGAIFLLTVTAVFFATRFELDASAESLVLESDKSLEYYREIRQQYGSDEFLIITFTPEADLLSDASLNSIRRLRDRILGFPRVEKVNSILDVPIIYTTGASLNEIGENPATIESPGITREEARAEFLNNPFYRNLLVSKDGNTTALQIIYHTDKDFYTLTNRRNALQGKRNLTSIERVELEKIQGLIKQHNSKNLSRQEKDVSKIRQLMKEEEDNATLYLGGIPMITVDMIHFIRHDLVVFGAGVFIFLVLMISLFFRKIQWVVIPVLCCAVTGLLTVGLLGLLGWRVTVISSNFLSILLIITLSLIIHLIVRYRDLQIDSPHGAHPGLVRDAVLSMARPCFYTILTTVVAFASLLVSGIRPVIDFGWIMVIGLSLAFFTCFLLFPAALVLMPGPGIPSAKDFTRRFMLTIAGLVESAPGTIILLILFAAVLTGTGIWKLEVENRFIDNFKSSTEIYKGMKVIDQKLGGTTPLDIIIGPDTGFLETRKELADMPDELEELFASETGSMAEPNYWLNPQMLVKVRDIHEKLESYPITGKVLSLGTAVEIVERLNRMPLDEFELALIRKRIPDSIARDLINPYLSEDANQVRFSVRVRETDPSLNRKQLLESIRDFLVGDMQFEDDQVHLTGMLVLYNNMLQSLYRSQILTIGAVFIAIFIAFVILFRNFQLALIAIIPNMVPTVLILGFMGWAGIPLDMMTITIAAITIGISVDNTIHYIHRFQREYPVDRDFRKTVRRCHGGVGKAMFYTSVAIIFGFSILSLSNFIPTIYFGLLTGFAMLVALLADLLFLPAIILMLKPAIK